MADQNFRKSDEPIEGYSIESREKATIENQNFYEETAAEIAAPINAGRERQVGDREQTNAGEGRGTGYLALILSIVSLFFLPVILGAAGIIVGFMARRRGAKTLGAWAIGIGITSVVLGVFFTPFF